MDTVGQKKRKNELIVLVDISYVCSVLSQTGLSKYPGLKESLLEMYGNGIDSVYLMSTLIDIYEEELQSGLADSNCLEQALEVMVK